MNGSKPASIPLSSSENRPFDAAALERDLRGMWRAADPKYASVVRAALANLIVPLSPGDFDRIGPVLIDVTRRHPARLFRVERSESGSAGDGLRSYATALCHLRAGGGSICTEEIVLSWDDASGALVPSAVASLLVGDLPAILLELNQGLDPPWQEKLAGVADVRIIDSSLAPSDAEYPSLWRRRPGRAGGPLHDLAWARLAPWREILAETFDRPETARAISSIQDVTIHHVGADPPSGAWLLAGWLASRLGWTPRGLAGKRLRLDGPSRPVSVSFVEDEEDASGNHAAGVPASRAIVRVRVRSGAPVPLDVAVEHRGHAPTARVVQLTPRAKERDVPFAYRELAACIAGELHRHEPNRAFEEAAGAAEEMIARWRKG